MSQANWLRNGLSMRFNLPAGTVPIFFRIKPSWMVKILQVLTMDGERAHPRVLVSTTRRNELSAGAWRIAVARKKSAAKARSP